MPALSSPPYIRRLARRTHRWSVCRPGTTTEKSTPRFAVRMIAARNALSGRKYGVAIRTHLFDPSTIVWYSTRDEVARSEGELLMANAGTVPTRERGL